VHKRQVIWSCPKHFCWRFCSIYSITPKTALLCYWCSLNFYAKNVSFWSFQPLSSSSPSWGQNQAQNINDNNLLPTDRWRDRRHANGWGSFGVFGVSAELLYGGGNPLINALWLAVVVAGVASWLRRGASLCHFYCHFSKIYAQIRFCCGRMEIREWV